MTKQQFKPCALTEVGGDRYASLHGAQAALPEPFAEALVDLIRKHPELLQKMTTQEEREGNTDAQQLAGEGEAAMATHRVYASIVKAVRSGVLKEPLDQTDFRRACPGFGEGTYQAFLHKHRLGNPSGASELFELVGPGKFRLVRPFRHGL